VRYHRVRKLLSVPISLPVLIMPEKAVYIIAISLVWAHSDEQQVNLSLSDIRESEMFNNNNGTNSRITLYTHVQRIMRSNFFALVHLNPQKMR
jgi:hypothetical protein